ncbi:hypothetical protein BGZ83_006969 [Gryganskiella cystojenkinii]|nr:hypothetical protein BGZ83_006969 [Gryganskiella cystojenkinii]
MRIALLLSSHEGVDSEFKDTENFPDPSHYITAHEFVPKYIKKDTAKEQIDRICDEGFDLFMHYMWGQKSDGGVAGIEAIKLLESNDVPFIGPSSKFLSYSKADFKKLAANVVNVPGTSKFPLILKSSRGCGSLRMAEKSVCHSQDELSAELELLQSWTSDAIIIEEFIVGQEFSVTVIEVDDTVIAMSPLLYEFPAETEPTQQFLHFKNKYNAINDGVVKFRIYDGKLAEQLKETARKAYQALDVSGSGYARIDLRANEDTVYVLGVNPLPCFFYKPGNNFGDDDVIRECFPGGHVGLMETLISAKMPNITNLGIKERYDVFSARYNDSYSTTSCPTISREIATRYSFQGEVLDLGCGTGCFGEIVQSLQSSTVFTGIDISPRMAEQATHYKKVYIGAIQNVIPFVGSFDHVVSFGVLHFLDQESLSTVLHRCFSIARRSITVGVEDIPDIYNKHLLELDLACMYSHNHTSFFSSYAIPEGWRLVYMQREHFWNSPKTGDEIYGTTLRFEREKQ